jgi:hypothetical protein
LPQILAGGYRSFCIYIWYNATCIPKTSPFCRLYNKEPNTKNLKIWGSVAYYKEKTTSSTKLEPRAKLGILVGYNQYKYYVLDLKTDKIIRTRDATILEGKFVGHNSSNKETITIDYNEESESYQEFTIENSNNNAK